MVCLNIWVTAVVTVATRERWRLRCQHTRRTNNLHHLLNLPEVESGEVRALGRLKFDYGQRPLGVQGVAIYWDKTLYIGKEGTLRMQKLMSNSKGR